MKVLICGGGRVGFAIAGYLARENNHVVVIDRSEAVIRKIGESMEVTTVTGNAAHPDVLKTAGIEDAEMLIAVTGLDEVNMMACQVAASLFNTPKKIARVRAPSFLDPAWANLFSRQHLPIDLVISPENEVAQDIVRRLSVPGTTTDIPMADGQVYLIGVICRADCPVLDTPIRQFDQLFPDFDFRTLLIIRGNQPIMADPDQQFLKGDEVYMLVRRDQVHDVVETMFGLDQHQARHLVIFGGGNIGVRLTQILNKTARGTQIKLIEKDPARAAIVNDMLPRELVICGDGLETAILEEAGVAEAETFIAVTNNDEANVLGSLLAKQVGSARVITLVNNSAYNALMTPLGIDAIVNPKTITVSSILQYIRRGRIRAIHSLRDGAAELIDAEVSNTCTIANTTIGELTLPEGVLLGAIVKKTGVFMAKPDLSIEPGDRVILLARQGCIEKAEGLFSFRIDLF